MSPATATNPMGLKRICTSCGVRFYDMNNRPIVCPSCETEFTGEIKPKTRRGRTANADKVAVMEAEKKTVINTSDDEEEEDLQTVSLNDLEEDDFEDEDEELEAVSLDDDDLDDDDADGDQNRKLVDEDDLDDIPDLDDDLDDDLGDDDDTLLEDDDD